ncbi:hypothetical protein BJY24_004118 [Nocardia transvalensis]|uniref:Uncharacterized protein n=1 Tax=Nocardia transvalensis TaxID=37333 RepID=A0A7W9PFI8_9NOCA|nr:hypothetical protein [Nocardia transvalensis]MBB5915251.1 hypothetical protein [Nocardia transvalensis]
MTAAPPAQAAFDWFSFFRSVSDAAGTYMNGLAPQLPPLSWTCGPDRSREHQGSLAVVAYVSPVEHADPATVAVQWRDALGLDQTDHTDHRRWYFGRIDPFLLVQVWHRPLEES